MSDLGLRVGSTFYKRIGHLFYKCHVVVVLNDEPTPMVVYRWYGKRKQWWHYEISSINEVKTLTGIIYLKSRGDNMAVRWHGSRHVPQADYRNTWEWRRTKRYAELVREGTERMLRRTARRVVRMLGGRHD